MEHSMKFYLPLIFTVVGTLLYHIAQKTMPPAGSPFLPLAVAFAIATALCVFALTVSQPATVGRSYNINLSSVGLGVAVVMIEAGYLLAYRLGWKVNRAALISNVSVAILLIPVGAILFHERASFRMMAGVSLCISGLILLFGR
jgi:uncharacterized membrane protein